MNKKCLIIYAHPNKLGHCGRILSETIAEIERLKWAHELLDLYEMGFDPVLKPTEHYTSGNREISEQNREIQRKITSSDCLIFIYPTWWQNMPAILKGFLDRIFTPRFAFVYEKALPIGLLKGKKAAAFVTTGAPMVYNMIVKCNRTVKVLTSDTLGFCGIKAKGFVLSSAGKLNNDKDKKIKELVQRGIKYLSS